MSDSYKIEGHGQEIGCYDGATSRMRYNNQTITDPTLLNSSDKPVSTHTNFNGLVQPSEGDSPVDLDFSDAVLKYINNILREEDLDEKTFLFRETLALQAAEKSFYEVVMMRYAPPAHHKISPDHLFPYTDFSPRFSPKQQPDNTTYGRKEALIEHNVAASDSKRKEKGKKKIEEPSITASDPKRKEKGKQKREAASDSMTRDKGERKTGLSLTYEVLKSYFGKKLENVEEELGCKRSTIKRACRKYGIKRWPNKKEHIKNLSLFERGSGSESTNTESNRPPIVEKETEKVIIKVKYKEDTIKFELCLSLGVSKLFEQVATRLKLNLDAFKVKYKDEDGDEILLACDADLHLCPKSQTAEGKTSRYPMSGEDRHSEMWFHLV